jgi:hypothetical protein
LTGRAEYPTWRRSNEGPAMQGHDQLATIIGFIGVALLLLAFLLNLVKLMSAEGAPYLALNVVGGAMALTSSWLIDFIPFVILEVVWTTAALIGLIRVLRRRERPSG